MQAYGKFSGTQDQAATFKKQVVPVTGGAASSSKVLPWADLHTVKAASPGAAGHYTVRAGDTVYQVMRVTGVAVPELIR